MILYSNTMSGWMSGGRGHGWLDHHNWPFKNSIIIIMFLLFCYCSSSTSSRNCAINFIGCFNRFSIQYNLGIPSPHPLICIWWNFNAKRIPSFRLSLGRKFHFYCRILNLFFVWSRKRGEQKNELFSTCTWCCPQLQQSASAPPGRILLEDIKLFPYFPSLA